MPSGGFFLKERIVDIPDHHLIQTCFSLHGLNLRVRSNNEWIQAAVQRLLAYFQVRDHRPQPAHFSMTILDGDVPGPSWCSPPARTTLHYTPSPDDKPDITFLGVETLEIRGDGKDRRFFVDFGKTGRMAYRLDQGAAYGYINRPEDMGLKVFPSMVLMLVLGHLLAARGYFHVHCSAVEKGGRGILLPGFSGSGKTTACIALIRRGFGFLGDDRPLVSSTHSGGLRVLAFPEEIDVTDNSIDLFPELKRSGSLEDRGPGRKKSFAAERVYPGVTAESCVPEFILYPEIIPGAGSRLEEMPKNEAMSAFLPHSLFVMDRKTTERHFDLIYDLIQSTACYRLKFGSDVRALPDLVETLL